MALFICFYFYAGALTMFKEPLARWSAPAVQFGQDGDRRWTTPEQWPALIDATLREHPEAAKGFMLYLTPQENLPAPLVWRERRGEAGFEFWWSTLDDGGSLRAQSFQPGAMAELIDQLHRTAGIPGQLGHHAFGEFVMGAVCVLYALALFSGLVVLLPTLVADFFALRPGKNLKRFWLDAHNIVGITSLPFHLMIALTVIVFAFHDPLYDALGKLVYGDRPLVRRRAALGTVADDRQLLPPLELVARLREQAPHFEPKELIYQNAGMDSATVRVAGEAPFAMLRGASHGFAMMNPYTGEVTDTTYLPGVGGGWGNVVTTFFALHFGNFGGALIRWTYFLMGLGGAFLFYSGNLLWVESRRRRQRRRGGPVEQSRSARLMAAATVGVCWGSVAGISTAMVVGKWLHGVVADLNGWYMAVYYVVFLGSIAWAFRRGAARALVHLLRLCALTTLAIPATGLLALLPSLPPWLHTAPDLLAVEATALVAGMAFVVMARRTARRIRDGAEDSVWSAARAWDECVPSKAEPGSSVEREVAVIRTRRCS